MLCFRGNFFRQSCFAMQIFFIVCNSILRFFFFVCALGIPDDEVNVLSLKIMLQKKRFHIFIELNSQDASLADCRHGIARARILPLHDKSSSKNGNIIHHKILLSHNLAIIANHPAFDSDINVSSRHSSVACTRCLDWFVFHSPIRVRTIARYILYICQTDEMAARKNSTMADVLPFDCKSIHMPRRHEVNMSSSMSFRGRLLPYGSAEI